MSVSCVVCMFIVLSCVCAVCLHNVCKCVNVCGTRGLKKKGRLLKHSRVISCVSVNVWKRLPAKELSRL